MLQKIKVPVKVCNTIGNTKCEKEVANMGLSYQYSGSSSYPLFDEELSAVAAVFGGVKTEQV